MDMLSIWNQEHNTHLLSGNSHHLQFVGLFYFWTMFAGWRLSCAEKFFFNLSSNLFIIVIKFMLENNQLITRNLNFHANIQHGIIMFYKHLFIKLRSHKVQIAALIIAHGWKIKLQNTEIYVVEREPEIV